MNSQAVKLFFTLVTIGAFSATTAAQGATSSGSHSHAHELGGFLLRQELKAFVAALDKPFYQKAQPNTIDYAFHYPGTRKDYLVAMVVNDKDSYLDGKAVRIELTGPESTGQTGFFGLKLGDSPDHVQSVLGKPDQVRHEDDVNLDLWDFTHQNYSLEFGADHRLYSIQINDEPKPNDEDPDSLKEVRDFADSIQTNDVDHLLNLASGEIECSQKEAYGIQDGSARSVLNNRQAPVMRCLSAASKAILQLGPDLKGTETNIRIWEKGPPGMVVKFPTTSPLREVVLFDEAGAPRVYEVTFR